jgi:hypothetical protein
MGVWHTVIGGGEMFIEVLKVSTRFWEAILILVFLLATVGGGIGWYVYNDQRRVVIGVIVGAVVAILIAYCAVWTFIAYVMSYL